MGGRGSWRPRTHGATPPGGLHNLSVSMWAATIESAFAPARSFLGLVGLWSQRSESSREAPKQTRNVPPQQSVHPFCTRHIIALITRCGATIGLIVLHNHTIWPLHRGPQRGHELDSPLGSAGSRAIELSVCPAHGNTPSLTHMTEVCGYVGSQCCHVARLNPLTLPNMSYSSVLVWGTFFAWKKFAVPFAYGASAGRGWMEWYACSGPAKSGG